MIKNLIFDLDGCLIDSSAVQRAALFGSYHEVVGDDKCPTYEEYIKHTGDSVDNVLAKLNLPPEMAAPFRRISSESVDKVIVNWEAIDLIRKFKKLGCGIAICTGKDRYRTIDILDFFSISDCFDALVCADDVEKPKPSPVPIQKAMELLHTTNEESIVIGDGFNDLLSAKRANVKSILTLWYGDAGVSREADYIAETVSDLERILKEI